MDLETVATAVAPRLLAYATARTGCRSTAEDVTQDALVALIQHWRRRGPPDSPDAFVFAIARRRAARAMARRAVMSPLDVLWKRPDVEPGADVVHEHHEELRIVLKLLRRLPRRDREVLLLTAAGDVGIADIAAITRATTGAAKMRLHRARQRLAALQLGMTYEPARKTD
jgi:RNA polymerase sigma-70 factor (ECF subfamily)